MDRVDARRIADLTKSVSKIVRLRAIVGFLYFCLEKKKNRREGRIHIYIYIHGNLIYRNPRDGLSSLNSSINFGNKKKKVLLRSDF